MEFKNKIMIQNNKQFWALLIILAFGLILRIYDLGTESLWYDEIESIDQATRDLPVLFSNFHVSPLYFLLLKYWMGIFGISEFALRFLSVIFGMGSIFLIYKIAKILFNKKVGLFSSLILAASPFHLFYSQEIRHYSLFLFLALLSMLFFLKIIKTENSHNIKAYIYYAAATALLLYANHWSIFLLFVQNLFFFSQKMRHKKSWVITQAAIFFLYSIRILPFIIYFSKSRDYVLACLDWIPMLRLSSLIEVFRTFSYGGANYGGHDFSIDPRQLGISSILIYIFGFFSIYGLFFSPKRDFAGFFLLAAWLFVPIFLLFTFSLTFFPAFVVRYLIFVAPAYYILAAKGIDNIRSHWRQKGVVFIIVIFTFPALHFYYKNDIKTRWNEAVEYIEKNTGKGDFVVIVPSHHIQMLEYIAIKNKTKGAILKTRIIEDLGIKKFKGEFIYPYRGRRIVGINNLDQLKRIRRKIGENRDIWLILSRWACKPEEIVGYLEFFYRLDIKKHFEGVKIFHYAAKRLIRNESR